MYKKYSLLKEKLDNDENLKRLKEEIEQLKSKVCQSKNEEDVNRYYEIENVYKSNPVVKEYLCVKEELHNLLKEIVDILSLN